MPKTETFTQGPFRGEIEHHEDGIGICVWRPINDDSDLTSDLCITDRDLDDLVTLLATIRDHLEATS